MSTVDYFLRQLKSREDAPPCITKTISNMIAKNHIGHEWQLKLYSTLNQKEYESSRFSAQGSDITWSLIFEPYFEDWRKKAYIRITLKAKPSGQEARVFYRIRVLDDEGNAHHNQEGFIQTVLSNQFTFNIPRSEISVEKKTLSLDGTLTLACDVFEVSKYINNPSHLQLCYSSSEMKAQGLLEQLLEKCKSSPGDNVTLVGKDDVRVEASQFVLAARSVVLRAMLNTPMKEQRTKVIELKDIDGEVLKKMVDFINTDTVSDLDKFAEPLLVVADCYQLLKLKMLCEEHLIQSVGLNTILHLKTLAEMTNSPMLKESCRIFSNSNQVREHSNEEPALKKSRP